MDSPFPSRCPQPRPPASSPVQVSPPESEGKDTGRERVESQQPPALGGELELSANDSHVGNPQLPPDSFPAPSCVKL